jgi:hypothetical protein
MFVLINSVVMVSPNIVMAAIAAFATILALDWQKTCLGICTSKTAEATQNAGTSGTT